MSQSLSKSLNKKEMLKKFSKSIDSPSMKFSSKNQGLDILKKAMYAEDVSTEEEALANVSFNGLILEYQPLK